MDLQFRLQLAIDRYNAEHARKEGLDGSLTAPFAMFSALVAGEIYLGSGMTAASSTWTWIAALFSATITVVAAIFLLRSFWLHKYKYVSLPLEQEYWLSVNVPRLEARNQYRAKYPEAAKTMAPDPSIEDLYMQNLIVRYGTAAAECFFSNNRRAWFRVWGIAGVVAGYCLLALALLLQRVLDCRANV